MLTVKLHGEKSENCKHTYFITIFGHSEEKERSYLWGGRKRQRNL